MTNIQPGNAGFSSTANITNLNIKISRQTTSGSWILIEPFFNNLCVDIPYQISHNATTIFNSAWASAKNDLYSYLRANVNENRESVIREVLKGYLLIKLNVRQPGSTISTSPNMCYGAPITRAKYCY